MHEWHTNISTNPNSLINSFIGYEFMTDYSGTETVKKVKIIKEGFTDEQSAMSKILGMSYGGNTAYLTYYSSGKRVSVAFTKALNSFIEKYTDYNNFKDNLTIAFGRKSSKVTCPYCNSSINLNFGKKFKVCPVCGSNKIISDSNWKTLDTKKKLVEKASSTVSTEASKCGITFICGIEWHS